MKKCIAITVMVLMNFLGYSQSSFVIKALGDNYSSQEIQVAFQSANFCGFYYQEKRNTIILDDGAVIELPGMNENSSLSTDCVRADDYEFRESVWSISTSGIVVRKENTIYHKEQQK